MSINIQLPDEYTEFKRSEFRMYREDLRLIGSGIYVLYSKYGAVLYVGKAKDLLNRVRSHLHGRSHISDNYRLINKVRVYAVADDYSREIYETFAIHALRPTLNTSKTYHPDFIRLAEEEIAEIDVEIRTISEEMDEVSEIFYDFDDKEYVDRADDLVDDVAARARMDELSKRLETLKRRRYQLVHRI